MRKIILSLFLIIIIVTKVYAQKKNVFSDAPTVKLRTNVTTTDLPSDGFYNYSETAFGTTFDSSSYTWVRGYVKIQNEDGTASDNDTTCIIRPIVWNNATDKVLDSKDTTNPLYRDCDTGWNFDFGNIFKVRNNSMFFWKANHADKIQMLVDSINGDGKISIFIQGSNE